MKQSLDKAMYDKNNPKHHLIVLGDLFDRGTETIEVLEYLYELNKEKKATIILGNHDNFLLDFLDNNHSKVSFNIEHNGFGNTIEQLSGLDLEINSYDEIELSIRIRYPYLKEWLNSFPLYYELGTYIFVHGGIDGGMLDWKSMTSKREFLWNREINLPRVIDKIVVAGHHRVATIRKKTKDYKLLFQTSPELFDILYDEGKILIDRFVEKSKEINVLVLEF